MLTRVGTDHTFLVAHNCVLNDVAYVYAVRNLPQSHVVAILDIMDVVAHWSSLDGWCCTSVVKVVVRR